MASKCILIDGLIAQVLTTFERFNERKNDFGILTLQCCLDDILICNGGNNYSIQHMGKERNALGGDFA
jgi:hypothetical protein